MSEVSLKDVQQVELQILEQVKNICEKHNLKYFADSGTLLGAVRNNSFIPWDNDIDLVMMRDDYEAFIKIAEKELEYPYYLQTAYKDKGFYSGLIKIRKSDTTAILYSQKDSKTFNQGVFLDIFPLDKIPDNKKKAKLQLKLLYFYKKLMVYRNIKKISLVSKSKGLKTVLAILSPYIFICTPKHFYKRFDSISQWGNKSNSKYVDKIMFRGYHISKKYREIPISCYESTEIIDYENTKICIPHNSDKVCKILYGDDYMTPRQEPDCHGEIFFDLNNSYTKYINHELEIPEVN